MSNKLSSLIPSQLPGYIREEYPTFVKFLEAYYEFLEKEKNPHDIIANLRKYTDIDETLDEFVTHFEKQYLNAFPGQIAADKRLLAKHIQELYRTKGTEKSYQLLFRVLFNEDVELYYPKTHILKASDGKWVQEQSIQVKPVSGNIPDIAGNVIRTTNSTGLVTTLVTKVVKISDSLYEVFLSNNYTGSFGIGDKVVCGDIVGEISPTVTSYFVEKRGKNFKLGQLYEVKNGGGKGTVVKITKVDKEGGIERLSFVAYGSGYVSNFFTSLNPQKVAAEPASPYAQFTNGTIESGYITKPDYFGEDYSTPDFSATVIAQFGSDNYAPINTAFDDEESCVLRMSLGATAKYPGYYKTTDGFLSDANALQDSFYYQDYSYVIKSTRKLEEYKKFVKDILHPAGMKMFGEYQIVNEMELGDFLEYDKVILKLLEQDDFIGAVDAVAKTIGKKLGADTASTLDAIAKTTGKKATDTATTTDALAKTVGKGLADSTFQADGVAFDVDKVLADQGLILDGRINHIIQNTRFESSAWGKAATSIDLTTIDQIVAPDGSLTAEKLFATATASTSRYMDQRPTGIVTGQGNAVCWSIYVKSAGLPKVQLANYGDPTTNHNIFTTFDLSTGAVTNTTPLSDTVRIGSGAEDAGNGWWRVWHSFHMNNANNKLYARIFLHNGSTTTFAGDGTSGVYVWGAQLENASSPTPLIITDATAVQVPAIAFDVDKVATPDTIGTSDDPNQMVRTNIVTRSSNFNSVTWQKLNSNVVWSSLTPPVAQANVSKFYETTTANVVHQLQFNFGTALVNGDIYTTSIYAKAGELDRLRVRFGRGTHYADFNLTTKASFFSGGSAIAKAEDVGGGWVRCIVTSPVENSDGTSANYLTLTLLNSTNTSVYTGDGVSGVYICGAQVEPGTAASPLIFTDLNAVTVGSLAIDTGKSLADTTSNTDAIVKTVGKGLADTPSAVDALSKTVGKDVVDVPFIADGRTNFVRNNTMQGAALGPILNQNTTNLPTLWPTIGIPGGMSMEVVGLGTYDGIETIDIRVYGTPTTTLSAFGYEAYQSTPAEIGQTWSMSVYMALVAGSMNGFTAFQPINIRQQSSTVNYGDLHNPDRRLTINSTLTRFEGTGFVNNADVTHVNCYTRWTVSTGVPIDATFRIGLPQIERGGTSTAVIRTYGEAVTVPDVEITTGKAADDVSFVGDGNRTNNVIQSGDLSNAAWNPGVGGFYNVTSVTEIPDPFGGSSAVTKFVSVASADPLFARQNRTFVANVRTTSLYIFVPAQAGVTSWQFRSDYQDTENGSLFSSTKFGQWVRAYSTATVNGSRTSLDLDMYTNSVSPSAGYTFYATWVQEENGPKATPYIPTGSVPVTETARKNAFPNSRFFDTTNWTKTASSLSDAVEVSSGVFAKKLIEDTATSLHRLRAGAWNIPNNEMRTMSVFVKAAERTRLMIQCNAFGNNYMRANFDLTAVNFTTNAVGLAGSVTAGIVSLGDGVYRCWLSGIPNTTDSVASCDNEFRILNQFNTDTYAGTGTSGLYLWDAQLELGSSPTPYIYTDSTAISVGGLTLNIGKSLSDTISNADSGNIQLSDYAVDYVNPDYSGTTIRTF